MINAHNLDWESASVVIFANRKDFFLTKLCVASVRNFYPDVEIFIVKDKLNGDFYTARLCKAYNVKILKLNKRYFGWSAAKVHFLLEKSLPKKRYLCLDSDIIFVGKVLDKINRQPGSFILDPEFRQPPFDEYVCDLYLDPEKVKKYYPDYEYPGYFFNAGQTVVTPGLITEELLKFAFDPHTYPFYINRDAFKLVDQAVLNGIMPILIKREKIEVSTITFMKWSVSFFEDGKNATFNDINKSDSEFLVHYAGDVRTPVLEKMKGANLLKHFRSQYYKKLNYSEKILDRLQDHMCALSTLTKILYKKNRVLIELSNRINKKR